MGKSKYGSYRGRRKGLKEVLGLFFILVIVLSIGYLIWGDHGLGLEIFPRFAQEEVQTPEVLAPEVELIIDEPEAVATPQASGLLLGTDVTLWMDQDLSGFDQLVLTVKDATGMVSLPVALSQIQLFSDYTQENATALDTILALDVKSSAWMSVLQDPSYGAYFVTASALMSERGFGYKDENGVVWLDPGKADTIEYVTALVDQWIAMGFDELILSDFHYPQTGDVDSIRYASDDPDQALTDLLTTIHAQTQAAGVELGMVMSAGALVGGTVPYEDWTGYVDTFYATSNDLPTAESLVGADKVVAMAEQVPTSGDYLLIP